MQWKLPRPGRLADRLHTWALDRGFPKLAAIAPRWPRWLLFLNARWVIGLGMFVYPKPKRAIRRNLARILGRPPGSLTVRRQARRMLRNFAYYWVDLFRFAQLPPEEGRRLVAEVEGIERVEALREEGSGVVLLTGHLGNWELGGVLLGQRDLPVSIVYVADRFAQAEAFRSSLRRASGVEEIEVRLDESWSSLPVLRALRENRIVGMQGDRDFDEQGIEADLFGGPVPFPRGPFLVSLLTGAPIVPTFLSYTSRYRFRAEFGEPIRMRRDLPREEALRSGVERWARVLEEAIARDPTQWYTFFDYWGSAPRSSSRGGSG